jgi:MAP/microtubule affinity-regulating kinase
MAQPGLEASSSDEETLRAQYMVLGRLGQGRYGQVRLAYHRLTGTEVAVKCLKKTVHKALEVDLMRALQHPHVMRLFQVIEAEQHVFLVMEHAGRGQLWHHVLQHGRLREGEARRLFWQMACALHYCHAKGIAHRDLKPDNILLDELGNVKVADFGMGTWFMPGQKLHFTCGALAFRAPEVYLGHTYEGPKVDVWSLGVILYFMVTGKLPFKGNSYQELKPRVLKGRYVLPYHISALGRSLINCLLTPDPAQRPTLKEVLLHPWLSHAEDCPPTPSSEKPLPVRLNPTIVVVMTDMGFESHKVRDSLLRRRCDEAACTYHMLQCQKRQGREAIVQLKPVRHRARSCPSPEPPPPFPLPRKTSASVPALRPITTSPHGHPPEDDAQSGQGSGRRTKSASPLSTLQKTTNSPHTAPQPGPAAALSSSSSSCCCHSSGGHTDSSKSSLGTALEENSPPMGKLQGEDTPSVCDAEGAPHPGQPPGGTPPSTSDQRQGWKAVTRRMPAAS